MKLRKTKIKVKSWQPENKDIPGSGYGDIEIDGYVSDEVPGLAIHHSLMPDGEGGSKYHSSWWTITHLASGRAMKIGLPRRHMAIDYISALSIMKPKGYKKPIDWTKDAETVVYLAKRLSLANRAILHQTIY